MALLALLPAAFAGSGSFVRYEAVGFVPYFNYEGNLKVSGDVFLKEEVVGSTELAFTFKFIGTDPACAKGANASFPNSCGVHVHAGTSCSEDALGHYYDTSMMDDPWAQISYMYDDSGYAIGSFAFDAGLKFEEQLGHAFIVHSYDGSRIACAIISKGESSVLLARDFVPYFNYEGDLAVSGYVGSIKSRNTVQSFEYEFEGVDPKCVGGADAETPNSCGIHFHAGTSCSEDALGHYYGGTVASDPWISVSYTSTAAGTTSSMKPVSVPTGVTQTQVVGHTFIVHDYAGGRIACAIMQAPDCPPGCVNEDDGQYAESYVRRSRRILFSSTMKCPCGCKPE